VEAGRGKSVGGAAAIVGMLQCFGCGCLALIRRACNKKLTQAVVSGFRHCNLDRFFYLLIQRRAVLLRVREKKMFVQSWKGPNSDNFGTDSCSPTRPFTRHVNATPWVAM